MAEIVDIEDSPPPRAQGPRQPSPEELKQEVRAYLVGKDLASISLKALRLELENRFELQPGGLDTRKGEIRSIAEALVTEAQNAAPLLPPVVQEPAPKRRKMLATPQAADAPAPAEPLSPVKGKAPKKKHAPSAYNIFSKDQRAAVVEELQNSLQRKPTFAEICKAIPEKWKAVDEAQKAFYEQKAKIAKEQLALEPAEAEVPKAKKADAKKAPGKKGKGKGKGKQKAEDPVMTKAEFFRDCPVLRCALQIPSASAQASEALAPPMDLVARTFKSGGVGMFSSVKFDLPVGPQQVTVTAQVVMNVSGSKYWEDGEGYEAALKSLEGRAQEAQGLSTQEPAAVDEAPCTPERHVPHGGLAPAEAPAVAGAPDAEEEEGPNTEEAAPVTPKRKRPADEPSRGEEASAPQSATAMEVETPPKVAADAPDVSMEAPKVPAECTEASAPEVEVPAEGDGAAAPEVEVADEGEEACATEAEAPEAAAAEAEVSAELTDAGTTEVEDARLDVSAGQAADAEVEDAADESTQQAEERNPAPPAAAEEVPEAGGQEAEEICAEEDGA